MSNKPSRHDSESIAPVFAFSLVDLVARRSEKGHVQLKPGDVIDPKENDDAAIVVLKGRIEIQRDVWTLDGVRQVSLGHALKGHPLHELALFHPKAPREYEADNRYVVHEPTTILVLDREQLGKMHKELGDIRYMELLGTFVAAQAITKSTLLTRLTKTLEDNHNLHIKLDRRQTPPSQEALSSTGAFLQAAETPLQSEEALKNIEKIAALEEDVRVLNEQVAGQKSFISKLRETNVAAGKELLSINEWLTRQIVEIANAVRKNAADKGVNLTDEDMEQILKPTKKQVEEMPVNDAIVEDMVDSMMLANEKPAQEPAPLTSRSRLVDPEDTAPRRMPDLEKATKERSSPPPAVPDVPAPSTVQHGPPRKPSLLALVGLGSKSVVPLTQRTPTPPPPKPDTSPKPIAKTMVPSPHSAMPSTRVDLPQAKKGPPPLPKGAIVPPPSVPRPDGPASAAPSTAPAQPAAMRKKTPYGMDHVFVPPPLTQRGQGDRDPSIKMAVADLPPVTIIGVEEPTKPRPPIVAAIPEPFRPKATPPATKQVRLSQYSHVSADHLRSDDPDSVETGRATINLIPEDIRKEDERIEEAKEEAKNEFGVPAVTTPQKEVTKQYTFKKP